jgi:tetrahydromethanopterin S-methyltransferase subunit A
MAVMEQLTHIEKLKFDDLKAKIESRNEALSRDQLGLVDRRILLKLDTGLSSQEAQLRVEEQNDLSVDYKRIQRETFGFLDAGSTPITAGVLDGETIGILLALILGVFLLTR